MKNTVNHKNPQRFSILSYYSLILLFSTLLLLSPIACAQTQNSYIITNGQSDYSIVLPDQPIPAEQTAATELQDHLQQITGVTLPIIQAADYQQGPMIAVGFNAALPEQLRQTNYGTLADEELIIDSDGNTLLLAGGRPRGALYAVYEFLHRLGVRWYTPQYTHLPDADEIALPSEMYRYLPKVWGRKMTIGNNMNMTWLARNRIACYTLWAPLGEEYGGFHAEGPDMHTFWRLVPKAVLNAHPDWLSEADGQRELPVGTTWGLCLSNPEVRRYVIDRTLDYARQNPHISTIWIGQNDGSQPCTCSECQTFYDAHGGEPSSLVVQLINELSDAMAPEMPDRMVKTLAYSWSLTPPENMTIRDNVSVMFCAHGSFFCPIESDPHRTELRESIAAWRELVDHIDIYFYYPFSDYLSPSPCTYTGAENIKWCADFGANQLYTAISGWGNSYGSESMDLRGWVFARLMWDPSLDPEALVDEFINDYYGPAAPAVAQAVELIHQDIFRPDGSFIEYENNDIVPYYVCPSKMRQINDLYEQTYQTMPEGIYKQRLSCDWVPYLWADFFLGYQNTGQYDYDTQTWSVPMQDGAVRNRYARLVKQFMADNGYNALSEARRVDPLQLSLDMMGIPWTACLLQNESTEAVVIPGIAGRIFGLRDLETGFQPLKEYYQGLPFEYPLFSTTKERINGADINGYDLIEANTEQAVLEHQDQNCIVQKTVSLDESVLTNNFTIEALQDGQCAFRSAVMLDLTPGEFSLFPILYIERTDGSWTERVMGIETDFWWIEEYMDLTNATGRMIMQRQDLPDGVLLTMQPDEIANVYFWYSRYMYPGSSPESCGIFRFFLYSKTDNLTAGQTREMTWSLQYLTNVDEVINPN